MVRVPVRDVAPVLAATEYVTVLFPGPDAPLVIAIHGALLDAVHAAVDEVDVRATLPVLAEAGTLADDGLNEKAELPAAAAWITGKTTPAMVSEPDLATPVFGVAAQATVPLPLPDAPLRMLRKELLLAAAQEHPEPAVTCTA